MDVKAEQIEKKKELETNQKEELDRFNQEMDKTPIFSLIVMKVVMKIIK